MGDAPSAGLSYSQVRAGDAPEAAHAHGHLPTNGPHYAFSHNHAGTPGAGHHAASTPSAGLTPHHANSVGPVPPRYPFQVSLSETSRALERRIMQQPRLALTEGPGPNVYSPEQAAVDRQLSPRRPENRSRELVPASMHQDLVHTNLYLQPELDKERRLRAIEQMRADRAERLFRDQLEKGVKHLERLTALQKSYDELERCAQAKGKMEETMRRSLEMQVLQLLEARSKQVEVAPSPAPSEAAAENARLRERVMELESTRAITLSAAGGNSPTIEDLEARARQLEAALQQARSEAAGLRTETTGLRGELGPLRTRCEATERRLAETQAQLLAAHQKHSAELLTVDRDYRARIDGYLGETESLSSKQAAAQAELQTLRTTHSAVQEKLAAAEQELRSLRQLQGTASGAEQQQRLLRSEIAAKDIELGSTRRQAATITEQLDAAQRTVAQHEMTIAELRDLEAKSSKADEQLREARRALQSKQQDLVVALARAEESEDTLRVLQERLAEVEGRLAMVALQNKEQAIKLDLTTTDRDTQRSNCDRLQDSLAEAQDRIAQLQRDVEAGRTAKGSELRGLSLSLDARAAELAMLRAELEAKLEQQQASARELMDTKQALFVLQGEMTTTRLQENESSARVATLTKQLEEQNAVENEQKAMVAAQQQQISELHNALHQAKQQAQTDLSSLQGQLRSLQALCSAREAELAQVRRQLDEADGQRAATRERLAEATAASSALRIEAATLRANKARLEQDLADRAAAIAEQQQRAADASAALVAAQSQLESDRQAAQRNTQELQGQIAELQSSLQHLQAALAKKDEEVTALRSGNSKISDRHSLYAAQREEETLALRQQLDATQRNLVQHQAQAEQRDRQIAQLEEAQTTLRQLQPQHAALLQQHEQLVQSSQSQLSALVQRTTDLAAQVAASDTARQTIESQAEDAEQRAQRAEAEMRAELASKGAEIDVLRRQQADVGQTQRDLSEAMLRCDMLERQQNTARDQHERTAASLREAVARAQALAQEQSAVAASLRGTVQERDALLSQHKQTSAAEIDSLKQQLDKLRASERQLEQQHAAAAQRTEHAARDAAMALERARAEHDQRCAKLDATVAQQKEEVRTAQQLSAELKAAAAMGNERAEILTRKLVEVEADTKARVAALQEQCKQMQLRLDEAKADADRLASEHDRSVRDLSTDRERAAATSRQQQATATELRRQLQESETTFVKLREEHQAALQLCARADENATAAKAEVAHLQERQVQMSEENRKLLQAVESERDRLNEDVNRQRLALVELERKATDMMQTVTGQRAQLATAERAIAEKGAAIATMEQSIMELEEKLIHEKTETYLVKLSEKDARIAALEMGDKKKHAAEIAELHQARAVDLAALREQFNKRSELMAGRLNTTRESLDRSRELSTRDDILDRLQLLFEDHERLRKYIDQLVAEVLKQSESMSMAILNGLPRMQHDAPAITIEQAEELPDEVVRGHIRTMDSGNKKLEMYVNQLLARIVEHKPAILEVMNMG